MVVVLGRTTRARLTPGGGGGTPTFDPVKYGECNVSGADCDYQPRPWDTSNDGPAPDISNQVNDIAAAFSIAPVFFQQELCTLDYIYIDTQTSSSRPQVWGLRERLHKNSCQKTQQAKHISISQQVWNSMTTTPYATYETSILNSLLNNPPLPLPSVTQWMGQLSYAAYRDPAQSPAPSSPNAIAVSWRS